MWQAQVFTLYPEVFPGPLNKGIYGKALLKKIWNLKVVNIRDYAEDKHKTVDDTPFGGGSGMLLKPDVLAKSIDQNIKNGERIFYLSPKGKKFDQKIAKDLSKEKCINLICGHFEGIDERILTTRNIEEISIGDFVLSGGETAALVLIDSILRLLPGVIGNDMSKKDESFENGLLEYPQYTKPLIWEKKSVPEVLLSGDHAKIKGPIVNSIKVVRSGKVRKAKLYYLRDRTGKSARITEKIKKKIGIDLESTPETVTEENLAPIIKEKSTEAKTDAQPEPKKESSEEKK